MNIHSPPPSGNPAIPNQDQLLLPLSVPDSSFRKTLQVVSDAGELIAALESGIPDAATLLKGFMKVPLPDWTTEDSSSETRITTKIGASKNCAGTHPFTIRLARSTEYMGPDGILNVPETTYRGSIQYTIGGLERHVILDTQPNLIATVISTLEERLLEPSVRETRAARLGEEAERYAESVQWIKEALTRPDAREARSPLHDTLCQFIHREADEILHGWNGDGYSWELENIRRAFLFSFPSGEALALARLNIVWCDEHGNRDPEQAVLVVASPHQTSSRFSILLLDGSRSVPESLRKAMWALTKE
jgi:hypothetical protein